MRRNALFWALRISKAGAPDETGTLADRIAAFEKSQIAAAISANGGRLKEAYESLGLSRKTLYDKMQKHGLSRDDFSDGRLNG